MSIVKKLESFSDELRNYYACRGAMRTRRLTSNELEYVSNLRKKLVEKAGKYKALITEIYGTEKVPIIVSHKEYLTDIWAVGLLANPVTRTPTALSFCIDATGQAIGKLKDDIKKGIRDEQGKIIEEPRKTVTQPPKAFIAHGGDSPALRKLRSFLEAIGVQPLVVEEQASEGRSVGENVDWYSQQADCAIILATKGDIDGKTGDFIPRGNVLMEIGKLQELFRGRIIYLLQSGTKFPTNVSEKVWGRFSPQSMDRAFTKVVRELRAFGILKAVKP